MNNKYTFNFNVPTYFGYVYKIIDLRNKKIVYVGQSRKLRISNLNNYFGSGIYLQRSIKKYGKKNFIKCFVDFSKSQEELNNLEIYYIKKYNTLKPNGYNIREGGNLTGIYYYGQNNPCSKTNMSEEKRKEKGQKKDRKGH